MLGHAANEIVCNTDVERTLRLAREDVDVKRHQRVLHRCGSRIGLKAVRDDNPFASTKTIAPSAFASAPPHPSPLPRRGEGILKRNCALRKPDTIYWARPQGRWLELARG